MPSTGNRIGKKMTMSSEPKWDNYIFTDADGRVRQCMLWNTWMENKDLYPVHALLFDESGHPYVDVDMDERNLEGNTIFTIEGILYLYARSVLYEKDLRYKIVTNLTMEQFVNAMVAFYIRKKPSDASDILRDVTVSIKLSEEKL